MDASDGRLEGEAEGEVEVEDGVLVLKRVSVRYRLRASAAQQETIDRVHGFHARFCPVYRSLEPAIDFETSWELIEEG